MYPFLLLKHFTYKKVGEDYNNPPWLAPNLHIYQPMAKLRIFLYVPTYILLWIILKEIQTAYHFIHKYSSTKAFLLDSVSGSVNPG